MIFFSIASWQIGVFDFAGEYFESIRSTSSLCLIWVKAFFKRILSILLPNKWWSLLHRKERMFDGLRLNPLKVQTWCYHYMNVGHQASHLAWITSFHACISMIFLFERWQPVLEYSWPLFCDLCPSSPADELARLGDNDQGGNAGHAVLLLQLTANEVHFL